MNRSITQFNLNIQETTICQFYKCVQKGLLKTLLHLMHEHRGGHEGQQPIVFCFFKLEKHYMQTHTNISFHSLVRA